MTQGPIDHHMALIYVMVLMAAADSDMTDRELLMIGDLVQHLPVFRDFDAEKVVSVAEQCADILDAEGGLDAVLGLIEQALPEGLRDTAYAIACDIAAADGAVAQEELRLLEMIRHRLDVDRLTAAAIERGIAALNRAG